MANRHPVAWVVAGVVLPAAAAAALVPVRGEVDNASAVLILAVGVLAFAVLGGRWPAAVSAVSGALSFDLLHTEPYGSMTIRGADDVLKTGLLLVLGLSAATLVRRRQEAEARLEQHRDDLRRVREVTRFATRSPEALVERLELELVRLLDLRSATFVRGDPEVSMPRITGTGVVLPPGTARVDPLRPDTWTIELPVCTAAGRVGHLVLHPSRPTSGLDLPPSRRELALTWADQLALALTSAKSPPRG